MSVLFSFQAILDYFWEALSSSHSLPSLLSTKTSRVILDSHLSHLVLLQLCVALKSMSRTNNDEIIIMAEVAEATFILQVLTANIDLMPLSDLLKSSIHHL